MGSNGMPMFDCSGFVIRVLSDAGVAHLVDTNVAGLKPMFPETANPQPGDLCFTETYHVTIYIGGGKQIGANGGNSDTHGDNPDAKVQQGSDGGDAHGSVEQMIRQALGLR
jgi:cell wall-associated NlpC family hydrolase